LTSSLGCAVKELFGYMFGDLVLVLTLFDESAYLWDFGLVQSKSS